MKENDANATCERPDKTTFVGAIVFRGTASAQSCVEEFEDEIVDQLSELGFGGGDYFTFSRKFPEGINEKVFFDARIDSSGETVGGFVLESESLFQTGKGGAEQTSDAVARLFGSFGTKEKRDNDVR